MSGNNDPVQALQDLGMTPTEAEVYVATLAAADSTGPVSGYRVAQDLGRDPANLAKVMAGLVRQGAVRVVQQKPRLYLPTDPDEFTAAVVRRVQERRFQALEILRNLGGSSGAGAPLLLADFQSALDQAAEAIIAAETSVVVYASVGVLENLSAPLTAAGARPSCAVAILCPAPVAVPGAEFTVAPGAPSAGECADWLQLVCDGRTWLAARAGNAPAGCWGDQAATATVMGETMELARRSGGLQAEAAALAAAAGGVAKPAPRASSRQKAAALPDGGPQSGQDEGLTFIIRHDKKN